MSTHSFKKFLQIYELFAQDPTVSKKLPMLASTRLYLDIFFQIYELFAQDPTVSKTFPMLASPMLCLDIFFQIYGCHRLLVVRAWIVSAKVAAPIGPLQLMCVGCALPVEKLRQQLLTAAGAIKPITAKTSKLVRLSLLAIKTLVFFTVQWSW